MERPWIKVKNLLHIFYSANIYKTPLPHIGLKMLDLNHFNKRKELLFEEDTGHLEGLNNNFLWCLNIFSGTTTDPSFTSNIYL